MKFNTVKNRLTKSRQLNHPFSSDALPSPHLRDTFAFFVRTLVLWSDSRVDR